MYVFVFYVNAATSDCNLKYGNCSNLCSVNQQACCGCQLNGLGPTMVCNCCPSKVSQEDLFYLFDMTTTIVPCRLQLVVPVR